MLFSFTTKHCNILNIQVSGLVVSEKIFSCFPIISLWQILTSQAWPIWTPNIKALCLMVSDKKMCISSSYCKSMGANDPRGVANLDPRGMIGRIYVGYH